MSDTSGDEAGDMIAAAPVESVPAPAPAPAVTLVATPAMTPPLVRLPLSRQNSQKPQCMNGPLYKQSEHRIVIARRLRRKKAGPLKQLACWLVDNQIGMYGRKALAANIANHSSHSILLQPHSSTPPCARLHAQGPLSHHQLLQPCLLQPRFWPLRSRQGRWVLHLLLHHPIHRPARRDNGVPPRPLRQGAGHLQEERHHEI
jgi:hypothetical protein